MKENNETYTPSSTERALEGLEWLNAHRRLAEETRTKVKREYGRKGKCALKTHETTEIGWNPLYLEGIRLRPASERAAQMEKDKGV